MTCGAGLGLSHVGRLIGYLDRRGGLARVLRRTKRCWGARPGSQPAGAPLRQRPGQHDTESQYQARSQPRLVKAGGREAERDRAAHTCGDYPTLLPAVDNHRVQANLAGALGVLHMQGGHPARVGVGR